MDDDFEEEEVGESDQRLLMLYSYLSKTMRFKVEKWQKMMSIEDYKALMMKFLVDPTMPKLVISMSQAGMLVPMTEFPTSGKFKSTYFIRLEDVPLTEQNMKQTLLIGDLTPKPLDEMQVFLEHVLVPLLEKSKPMERWSRAVVDDVKRKALETRDEVHRVRGLTQGLTFLPLPLGIDKVAEEEANLRANREHRVDFEMKHNMEVALYGWGEQINKVLAHNTKELLEKEKDPTPALDIGFWSSRKRDLENIYNQLREERVVKMASILELTNSPFYDIFKSIFSNVVAGLDEARSVDRHLAAVKKYLDQMESVDLHEADHIFLPLLYTLALVWVNCPYFKQVDRLITFLKEICNLVIFQSEKCLDPPSIFGGEVEETLPKLRKVVTNMNKFREVFLQVQKEIPQMFKPNEMIYPWNFHQDTIFKFPYEAYIQRLQFIEDIFGTCLDYVRLEKVEIGGWSGQTLSGRLASVLEDFNNLYNHWLTVSYNPTDLTDPTFLEDFENWKFKIQDFDARLAAVINLAYDECQNFEQLFKFINLFGPLLERPLVNKEIYPKYGKVIDMFEQELDNVKALTDEQIKRHRKTGFMEVPPYWPPVAGGMSWLKSIRKRITYPYEWIQNFNHPCTKSQQCTYAMEKTEEMLCYLDHIEADLLANWFKKIGGIIDSQLKNPLLNTINGKLIVNFSNELLVALKEVRYLQMLEVTGIPQEALDFYAKQDDLYRRRMILMKTVDRYNKMKQNSAPQEFDIVSEELKEIDDKVEEGMKTYDWNSEDSENFIDLLHERVELLGKRVSQAQENLKRIEWLVNQWNYCPIYQRAQGNKGELLEFRILDRVNARYDNIIMAGTEIFMLIAQNFRLLHNLPLVSGDEEEEEAEEEEDMEDEEEAMDLEAGHGDAKTEELRLTVAEELRRTVAEIRQTIVEAPGPAATEDTRATISGRASIRRYTVREDQQEQQGVEFAQQEEEDEGVGTDRSVPPSDIDDDDEKKDLEGPQGPPVTKRKKEKPPCPVPAPEIEGMYFERPAVKASYLSEIWKMVRRPARPDLSYEDLMEAMEHPDELIAKQEGEESPEPKKKKKKGKKGKGQEKETEKSVKGKKKKKGNTPKTKSQPDLKTDEEKKDTKNDDEDKKEEDEEKKADQPITEGKSEKGKGKKGKNKKGKGDKEGKGKKKGGKGGTQDKKKGDKSDAQGVEYTEEYKKMMELAELLAEEEEDLMSPSELLFEEFKRNPEKLKRWDAYLDYIDEIVQEGLLHAVGAGVAYLLEEMKEKKKKGPLFMVNLRIDTDSGKLFYDPALEEEADNPANLIGIMSLIIQDINSQALLIPRISYGKRETTYLDDIGKQEDIVKMEEDLIHHCLTAVTEADKFTEKYNEFSFLWKEDKPEHLRQFLKFARILAEHELQMEGKTDEEGNPLLQEQKPVLDDFKEKIDFYEALNKKLLSIPDRELIECWLTCDLNIFKKFILYENNNWNNLYKDYLYDQVINKLSELDKFVQEAKEGMAITLEKGDYDGLVKVMGYLLKIRDRTEATDKLFDEMKQTMNLLKNYDLDFKESTYTLLAELPARWEDLKKQAILVKTQVNPLVQAESNTIRKRLSFFDVRQNLFMDDFRKKAFFKWDCLDPYRELDRCNIVLNDLEQLESNLSNQAALFEVNVPDFQLIRQVRKEIRLAKVLWDYINVVRSTIANWESTKWKKIDSEAMDMELKRFSKEIRTLDKDMRNWEIYLGLEAIIRNLITALRAITELQNPAIRDRHWHELMQATQVKFVINDETTLKDLLNLNLYKYEEEVKTIVDKSVKEQGMEKTLNDLQETWSKMEFEWEPHERTKIKVLKVSEELVEALEADQVNLQNMLSSKFIAHFFDEVSRWQKLLSNADQVQSTWMEVQQKWLKLETIFVSSEDIRRQLPEDVKRFDQTDKEFRVMLHEMAQIPNVIKATNRPNLYEKLDGLLKNFTKCEKALNQYLETKRLAFPRFYFISDSDLLDILSNTNTPELVCKHLQKLYDSLADLEFRVDSTGKKTKEAFKMRAKDGEIVALSAPCDCNGQVENWLNNVTDAMRATGLAVITKAVKTYEEKPREEWIFDYHAQIALLGTCIWWSTEVVAAFAQLEEGYENALKDYQKKQINQLNALINYLLGDLTQENRQKIMTICTIDVHSRDVVARLIAMKVENSLSFQWQSQLRHRWDIKLANCFVNICDAQFRYDYEYLGNTDRLVITPLTDRCYITLTQSLHLIMGGAPAGPAGTGKTETTKDLGKALGMMVYVFNCSEQMDYKSCGNIYKGLAQCGAWGCFDEFNRISVEVLSVVAVQVKTILDAIKSKKTMFNFQGERIKLVPTVGMFITMNPGYAGRAELPENLKALFRPCAMVVPDFEMIAEIQLIAQGFQEAKILSHKFTCLYSLCKELLSKQDHYDWGLRAIKSVLVVAGQLRRADRQRPEDQVLMRALRDFNIPKIVTDDRSVFMGLISDLFPSLDVPRKRDLDFERQVKQAAIDMKLQPEDNFILKIVQLQELFGVRHSVFIIGNAGTGKSMVWKTLHKTYANMKMKPHYNDLEPKAVTNDELFGIINPQTREWKDGLFSVLIREQAQMSGDGPKWMVMDGDIDPMWIESLNTVMDDNKVLTLASNERIALTKSMRLLFEISNLRTATPATVSRAGILYINPTDLGWNPCIASWVDTRKYEQERTVLTYLIDKYVPSTFEMTKKFRKITPIPEIAHIHMLITLLECLLVPANVTLDSPREWYETYFVFACIWAFGSACFQDQLLDWRAEFTKWWVNEFKTIKFPPEVAAGNSLVFNYCIDTDSKKFKPWAERVARFELDYEIPLQATLVNTAETTRVRYFLDLLIERRKAVMLIAPAGSGKSVIIYEKFKALSEDYAVTNIPFNFYTTSEMLQNVLEKPLEKKAGRNYGPQGNKTMIYFVDDLNMPQVDKYGTVQPHTLIRQYMDYQHWYDRGRLTLKDIHNIMFLSSMNPTAGSFTVDSRLQRHFHVFALSFPEEAALRHIYTSILSQHIGGLHSKFPLPVVKACDMIISLAVSLHARIAQTFLPTAIKFHYIFNLRDLSNVFQSIILTGSDCINTPGAFVRVWIHESYRVYHDKLVDHKDQDTFSKIMTDVIKKVVQEVPESEYTVDPLIFTHFVDGLGDPKYLQMPSWERLQSILTEAMGQYNDLVANMNLVLFEDAMSHVCRINRVMEMPRGNALLVGVGGSGKQSLTRLSAFISGLEAFQVQLKKGYSSLDLKADIAGLYMKAGLKNLGMMFLMTDSQVPEEKFLVLINDLLASGEIPELFADDEMEQIIATITPEVKGAGIPDTKENCWKFFIDRSRKNLKTMLCFSPVGSTLRVRARKFPALVNCTTIDWFMEWPKQALESVSYRFLQEIEELPSNLVSSVSLFMAYMHTTVNQMSSVYLLNERRYNYTTPKSFLELINLFGKILRMKKRAITENIERLQTGLKKLVTCSEQAAVMKVKLADQEKEVQQKNAAASELITEVSTEKEKVQKEQALATDEERKVRVIEEDVLVKQKVCEEDLAKAMPALIAAQEALNTLNKTNLTEMKSFGTPPEAVAKVAAAVLVLLSKKGKIPRDRSWKACKAVMGSADAFLNTLVNYDKDNIHPDVVKAVQPYINEPDFTPENIISKSSAAAGLCSWVINIMKYHEVYKVVQPKVKALAAANDELAGARQRLQNVKDKIALLEEKFGALMKRYNHAMNEKRACELAVQNTADSIDLANRLVNGLASENVRWRQSVSNLNGQLGTLPGDVLFVTAFISYVGCFTRRYREELLDQKWFPQLPQYNPPIPIQKDLDPMRMLTDDAQIAQWNNEGLPSDRMSSENATILMNSERWPLMIDPQLQGIKWIKTKYGSKLRVIRLGQKNYLDKIEKAVKDGSTLLIENIGETIDPVLDNLLGRTLIRKGKVLKIGDREIDYHPKFRLILHTKLGNPHYQPEIQAQTTLINFTVTKDGLEDQLLAEVVNAERPDLEAQKAELTMQQNMFKITLKNLEDDLLQRLSSAGENILSDRALVINLENTKKTSEDVTAKAAEAKITSKNIDNAREIYRTVAKRASIIYFIMNDLNKLNPLYQFSLKAFSIVFHRAIKLTEKADTLDMRVINLVDSITFSTYMYTSRGLFESDKLTFMAQLAIQILLNENQISQPELDFLLRFPYVPNETSPVDFLPNMLWGGILALIKIEVFENLDKDILGSKKRWKKFVEGESPERDKLPQDWKNKSAFQRLCIMRSLRPDRMTYATRFFIEEELGSKFVNARTVEFEKSYEEMTSVVPCFFILSPGVDPTRDVEAVGKKLGFTTDRRNLLNVSLGQGQEVVAESAIETGSKMGHWVILQNIHLVSRWLPTLDKKMEAAQENPHWNFRLFLSSEPAPDPSMHAIPQGVLESSIKITNEPPSGMLANLHKALDNFNQSTLEMCSKEAEFKAILFSLCYFHAVIAERRKFGPQGWNRSYPFNVGDLTISVNVLYNYLENNSRIPWEDLRYLFGEIMYGGHITDDWDRRLCRTYLEEYMCPDLVEAELFYAPGFPAPPNSDFQGYHMYIDAMLPPESPILYGLHPNAEIGFLTTLSENLFRTILELQPRDSGAASSGGISREEKVGQILSDIMDKIPEPFNVPDMQARIEDKTPYVIVALQECERMNILMGEIRRSLAELRLGLKGELTITSDMEELEGALFMDNVPPRWAARAYPSLLGLSGWYSDLLSRLRELETWVGDFSLPSSVWLGGFFNPQSFLTAIMQSTARKNEWPLDKMCLQCDVTKKVKEEFSQAPRDGAYINTMYMEGARWDTVTGVISDSLLREMFPMMPVIWVKAITVDKQETKNIYECPVYKTRQRGPTFVWTFNLKTKARPSKWTVAGVALLLSV